MDGESWHWYCACGSGYVNVRYENELPAAIQAHIDTHGEA
jgi:hypothetical protein